MIEDEEIGFCQEEFDRGYDGIVTLGKYLNKCRDCMHGLFIELKVPEKVLEEMIDDYVNEIKEKEEKILQQDRFNPEIKYRFVNATVNLTGVLHSVEQKEDYYRGHTTVYYVLCFKYPNTITLCGNDALPYDRETIGKIFVRVGEKTYEKHKNILREGNKLKLRGRTRFYGKYDALGIYKVTKIVKCTRVCSEIN